MNIRLRLSQLIDRSVIVLSEEGIKELVVRVYGWLKGQRGYYLHPSSPAAAPDQSPFRVYQSDIMGRYYNSIAQTEPDDDELRAQRRAEKSWGYRPLISVVMPVFNPPTAVFREAIESILAQTYSHLELCAANASTDPHVQAVLDEYINKDSRLRVEQLTDNRGISDNTNAALKIARGEFVAFMDHDDLLAPFALHAVVEALNRQPDLDVLYSDQDKLAARGIRVEPFLKPDWSPELLHNGMYTGHLSVYRKSLVDALGGLRPAYDGSQDYDLILRASEQTGRIMHIPQVLYHWRMLPTSAASPDGAKHWARKTNLAALEAAMKRRGFSGKAKVAADTPYNRFHFDVPERPAVSIIIPTDDAANAERCLNGLHQKTGYENIEAVVVTNTKLATRLQRDSSYPFKVRWVRYDEPFNFSRKCNAGASAATGDYLVFLNDDVTPLAPNWVEVMLEYARQPEIGAVSPKLLYANNTIQYAGMVTGVRDLVGTAFHTWDPYDQHYHTMASWVRNVSVLTGACLMIRAEVFQQIEGWDDANTPIANSDLDLSFKLRERGFRLVYTPFAALRHVGHQSIGKVDGGFHAHDASHLYMLARWGDYVSYDPYFPPHMRDLVYVDAGGYAVHAAENRQNTAALQNGRRFLLISHELSLSGAPLILYQLGKYLRSKGHFVTMAAPKGGKLVEVCKAEGIPVILDPEMLNRSAAVSRRLFGPFDVVVPSTALAWPAVHMAALADKPCVWLVHESAFGVAYIRSGDKEARRAFQLADAIVYPVHWAEALYRGFASDAHHKVVPYGIDDPRRKVLPVSPGPGRRTDRIRISHVGSIEYRKGIDVMIAALKLLPDRICEQVEVDFIGRELSASYAADMKRRARNLPNVRFMGEVEHSMVLRHIADSDVFVCTSREETGPLVAMEAMGLDTAVITTRVGVVSELINDGVDGYVVDVDDAEALAQRIRELVENPQTIARLSRDGRKFYERNLTLERYGDDLMDIFDEAIRCAGRGEKTLLSRRHSNAGSP